MHSRKKSFVTQLCNLLVCFLVLVTAGCGEDSQFETEPHGRDVIITRYKGTDREVVIPDTIGGKKVVGIDGILSSFEQTGAFENNSTITSVTIPGTVKIIGKEAFKDCTALMTVNIPDSVESIDDQAFRNATALNNVSFSKGLREIYREAFEGCSSLVEITIPETNARLIIGVSAFNKCALLERVSLPEKTDIVSANTSTFPFAGCPKLTIPTGHAELDLYLSVHNMLAKQDKTLEDYTWLRMHNLGWDEDYREDIKRIPLENYTLKNNGILPKISDEFGSKPNGKIFFMETQDFGDTPNVVYAQFQYLDTLLASLPKELAEKYTLTTTAEVEYVILFRTAKGGPLAYQNAAGERGLIYQTTSVVELYRISKGEGNFKKVRTLETIENAPEKTTIFRLGSIIQRDFEPRLKGYFDVVSNLK